MEFVIVGHNLTRPRNEIERMIKKMGGKIASNIHYKLAAVISNADEVRRMSEPILNAKQFDIQVVAEAFLTDVAESNQDPVWYIMRHNLCDWGGDVCNPFKIRLIIYIHCENYLCSLEFSAIGSYR